MIVQEQEKNDNEKMNLYFLTFKNKKLEKEYCIEYYKNFHVVKWYFVSQVIFNIGNLIEVVIQDNEQSLAYILFKLVLILITLALAFLCWFEKSKLYFQPCITVFSVLYYFLVFKDLKEKESSMLQYMGPVNIGIFMILLLRVINKGPKFIFKAFNVVYVVLLFYFGLVDSPYHTYVDKDENDVEEEKPYKASDWKRIMTMSCVCFVYIWDIYVQDKQHRIGFLRHMENIKMRYSIENILTILPNSVVVSKFKEHNYFAVSNLVSKKQMNIQDDDSMKQALSKMFIYRNPNQFNQILRGEQNNNDRIPNLYKYIGKICNSYYNKLVEEVDIRQRSVSFKSKMMQSDNNGSGQQGAQSNLAVSNNLNANMDINKGNNRISSFRPNKSQLQNDDLTFSKGLQYKDTEILQYDEENIAKFEELNVVLEIEGRKSKSQCLVMPFQLGFNEQYCLVVLRPDNNQKYVQLDKQIKNINSFVGSVFQRITDTGNEHLREETLPSESDLPNNMSNMNLNLNNLKNNKNGNARVLLELQNLKFHYEIGLFGKTQAAKNIQMQDKQKIDLIDLRQQLETIVDILKQDFARNKISVDLSVKVAEKISSNEKYLNLLLYNILKNMYQHSKPNSTCCIEVCRENEKNILIQAKNLKKPQADFQSLNSFLKSPQLQSKDQIASQKIGQSVCENVLTVIGPFNKLNISQNSVGDQEEYMVECRIYEDLNCLVGVQTPNQQPSQRNAALSFQQSNSNMQRTLQRGISNGGFYHNSQSCMLNSPCLSNNQPQQQLQLQQQQQQKQIFFNSPVASPSGFNTSKGKMEQSSAASQCVEMQNSERYQLEDKDNEMGISNRYQLYNYKELPYVNKFTE